MHQEHDTFFDVCKAFDALIVRCNPGGFVVSGDQGKFDNGMRALRKLDIQVTGPGLNVHKEVRGRVLSGRSGCCLKLLVGGRTRGKYG